MSDAALAEKHSLAPRAAANGARPIRIALVTDAWRPQVNGVVRTLTQTKKCLEAMGHTVLMVTPGGFSSIPCPTYPEIRLSLFARRAVGRIIAGFGPDAVHIATEGPLGLAARRFCLNHKLPFTTAYHTRFPEYIQHLFGVPLWLT